MLVFAQEVTYMYYNVHRKIWQGKFWQTIQVKAIGEEKFGE